MKYKVSSSDSPILVTLMMEALSFFETSVLTRVTWHNIPEDAILRSHHRENLKSCMEILAVHDAFNAKTGIELIMLWRILVVLLVTAGEIS
jgi:hypothetical protein